MLRGTCSTTMQAGSPDGTDGRPSDDGYVPANIPWEQQNSVLGRHREYTRGRNQLPAYGEDLGPDRLLGRPPHHAHNSDPTP